MVKERTPWHVKIRKLLKGRPYTRKELIRQLKIKEDTLYPTLKRMKDWEEIKSLKDGRIALIDYQPQEEQIKNLMIDKRNNFLKLRWPSIDEIAYEVGRSPNEIEKFVYKLAPEIGWRNPTKDDINFTRICIEVLVVYINAKYFVENIILKNGIAYMTHPPLYIAKMMGGEYEASTHTVRVPFPPDIEVEPVKGKIKKLNKEEFERAKEWVIWSSIRGLINRKLPTKEEKFAFSEWLIQQSYSDLKGFKIEFYFKTFSKQKIEVSIDEFFFRTIANVATNVAIKAYQKE